MADLSQIPEGVSQTPPRSPWGINFGGGLNSTAMIVECRRRGLRPDWILFADTGDEWPGTLDHVALMQEWCAGWCEVTIVRWERVREPIGFERLSEWCLRLNQLPSKAYGGAGCTDKWKIQPMDKWREAHGYQQGAFAVGYDAGESRRITKACERGDQPGFTAWYPLIAWGIDREGCQKICDEAGLKVGKSSCFFCPNMREPEWEALRSKHPALYDIAIKIETQAAAVGNMGRGGKGLRQNVGEDFRAADDRCHHGGCFT